ncbi:unnamed protein product [Polarella glacialis]|uniref:SF3 helicase domain-containing protein n=1 Tax=Polarella glacialis TaxID=89957 RepID=A0A813G0J0_POLGL|nr:unnamed protein product [Polarella glacialis]
MDGTAVHEDILRNLPKPMQVGTFLKRVADAFCLYMPVAEHQPLDSENLWRNILGADGLLYDFIKGEYRQATAEDRMLKTTRNPVREWDARQTVKDDSNQFCKTLCDFFRLGGKSLTADPANTTEDIKVSEMRKGLRVTFESIYKASESKMLKGLCKVMASDFEDADLRGIDEVVYFLRQDARVFSSHPSIVGMINLTGPRNGGKSYMAQRQHAFLGLELKNYGHMIMGVYLTSKPSNDPNKPMALKNQFKGKKGLYFKEMPNELLIPETVKDLLDARDGHTSGRANNSRENDKTTFAITFVLFGMSNSPVEMFRKGSEETGIGGKRGEVHTCYFMADSPRKGDPRERQADSLFATATMKGVRNDEFWFWCRAMYQTLDSSICISRHIIPLPASIAIHEEEAMGDTTEIRLTKWLANTFVFCNACDAIEWSDAMEKLTGMFGKVDKHTLTSCGISSKNKGQYRPMTGNHKHYLKLYNKSTEKLEPVKYPEEARMTSVFG